MKSILFSPDAGNMPGANSNDAAPKTTTPRRSGNLPNKDASLLAVAGIVSDKWATNNFMTLVWKTQTDFADNVAAFSKQLQGRNKEGGKRSQQTKVIANLNAAIEDALPFVKSYIADKFGPADAKSHYAEFGMVHRSASYELPLDRQNRKNALVMMMAAMAANGFDTKQYGTAWWTDIKTQYDAAVDAAVKGSGSVSNNVSELVTLRTTLRRVLHSVLLVLEANYPDTFEQVRRDWGFQKEAY